MRSVKLVLLLAMVSGACSDPVAPPAIDGFWSETFSIPGNYTVMELRSDGSRISGNGSWCGEAGPCGSVDVAGAITGAAVQLELTFITTVPPGVVGSHVEHFDGRLTAEALRGSILVETPGQPPIVGQVTYARMIGGVLE